MPWGSFLLRPLRRLVGTAVLPRLRPRGSHRPDSLSDVQHVAVVHWDNLGDAVLLLPVLREIKRNLPAAQLTLVHNAKTAGVFEHCPHVDVRIPQDVQSPGKGSDPHGTPFGSRRLQFEAARLLRSAARSTSAVDLVIGPDWLDPVWGSSFFDNALFRKGCGPSLLAGRAAAGLPTVVEIQQHHVPRHLASLLALGLEVHDDHLDFWAGPDDASTAAQLLPVDMGERPTVAVAVGAGMARRRWPGGRFGQVVSELVKRFDCRVVLVGGDDARREADHVHDVVSAVDLVGRTSVGQMAEVLRRSDLLIGNDSGPVHVAAAVGTASVVVSAHPVDGFPWVVNSPMRYHPWRAEHSVVRPGRRIEGCVDSPTCTEGVPHCVLSVDVDEVIEASVALLGPTLPTGREGDRS